MHKPGCPIEPKVFAQLCHMMVSLTEWQGHLMKNTNTNDKIQKIWKQLLKIKNKRKKYENDK